MKIVINSCFGGFGVSDKAMRRYAYIMGIAIYPEKSRLSGITYWTVPKSQRTGILSSDEFAAASMEEKIASNERWDELTINIGNFRRDDRTLVQVVEELGKESSAKYASLKVVEIPDDVQWEIDDFDGMETIHEVSRRWS